MEPNEFGKQAISAGKKTSGNQCGCRRRDLTQNRPAPSRNCGGLLIAEAYLFGIDQSEDVALGIDAFP